MNSATRLARYRIAFRRQRQHRLERSEKSVTVHREMAEAPPSGRRNLVQEPLGLRADEARAAAAAGPAIKETGAPAVDSTAHNSILQVAAMDVRSITGQTAPLEEALWHQ